MAANDQQIGQFLELFDGDMEAAISALKGHRSAVGPVAKGRKRTGASKAPVIVRVEELAKHYKRGKQPVAVLDGVSLEVHEGQFVALTGPSGSGKSTLLQMMGGLDKPTSGRVEINGTDINAFNDKQLSDFRNRTIGFVFQFFYLQPFLPLNENVAVPGMFARTEPDELEARVNELLGVVGLSDQRLQLPKQLSGGQIQRAAVARALLNNPKILLADEPTGNLDSANSKAIIDLFEQIRQRYGTTVVIVTHNPEIAARADREVRLKDGRLV